MASIQRRLGPNVEGGPFGLLQPFADGLKLLLKEVIIPNYANVILYISAPILVFVISIVSWSFIPFYVNFSNDFIFFLVENNLSFENKNNTIKSPFYNVFFNIDSIVRWKLNAIETSMNNYAILILLVFSSLNVYGIILGGWSSGSKYAFLGGLRSSAQMISYEVSIGLTILPCIFLTGSFEFLTIVIEQSNSIWFCFPLFSNFLIFLISMLAETNRAPFDLPEAEAELVAGYNVEYGSMVFALYFLGEYSSMLLMASVLVILFLGGWSLISFNISIFLSIIVFTCKLIGISMLYLILRACLPRYTYSQLMQIGWMLFLPFTLSFIIFSSSIIYTYICFLI
jgi:NADH-quinone oxidoreductase subunit H